MASGRDYVYDVRTKRESTFGVTETGAFVGHRCRAANLSGLLPQGKAIPDLSSVAFLHDDNDEVLGSQAGGTFTTEEAIEGLPTALDAAATYTSPNNSCVETFKQAFGNSHGAAGSLIAGAGSTTSALDVTATQGTRFAPGRVVIVTTTSGPGGAAQLEVALIRKIVGDTLHLSWALASIPATGSTVYNTETAYMDADVVGQDAGSVYAEFIGEDASDQWKMRGCAPTIDVVGAVDELLYAQVSYMVATASGPAAHGLTLGQTSPTGGGRKSVVRRITYFGNLADGDTADARSVIDAKDVRVHPGLSVQPNTGGGIETTYAIYQMRAVPRAEFDFTVMRGSAAYAAHFTDYGARQSKYFAVQYGTSVASSGRGGIVGFVIPKARMAAPVTRNVGDRFVHATVTLGALPPSKYTGGTTKIVKTPVLFFAG